MIEYSEEDFEQQKTCAECLYAGTVRREYYGKNQDDDSDRGDGRR